MSNPTAAAIKKIHAYVHLLENYRRYIAEVDEVRIVDGDVHTLTYDHPNHESSGVWMYAGRLDEVEREIALVKGEANHE